MTQEKRDDIIRQFAEVINRNSLENESATPDFILAEYLVRSLELYNQAHVARRDWYGESNLPKHQSQLNQKQPFFRTP